MKAIVLSHLENSFTHELSIHYDRLWRATSKILYNKYELGKCLDITIRFLGKEDPCIKDLREGWSLESKSLMVLQRLEHLYSRACRKPLIQVY
jgi:hypothetical protein